MQPFTWKSSQFAGFVMDISSGVEIVLQMIENDMLSIETGDDTMLNIAQRASLLRFAISSTSLLANAAEREIMDKAPG